MKKLSSLFLIGGSLLTIWIVIHVGASLVAANLAVVGWQGLAAVAALHLIAVALMGLAWWRLQGGGRAWLYIWGRSLRDAGSEVMMLSPIGGYALGARAPILSGIELPRAAASVVVDATLEFCSEIAYLALGVALLIWFVKASAPAAPILLGLGFAIAAAIGFIAIQTRHSKQLMRLSERLSHRWLARAWSGAAAVQAEIRAIYRSKGLWKSFLLHLAAWVLSGIEAWLILWLMGLSRSLALVLAAETLVIAARSASFLVPGAIGVQESTYLALGAMLGLPPEAALGLSLLKRGRDLVLGVPTIIAWHFIEGRHRRRGDTAGDRQALGLNGEAFDGRGAAE